jgi:hypothetical protein
VSEWLKELAWKASGRVKPPRGFESHPLRLSKWLDRVKKVDRLVERVADAPANLVGGGRPISDSAKRDLYETGLDGIATVVKAPSKHRVSQVNANVGRYTVTIEIPGEQPYETKVLSSEAMGKKAPGTDDEFFLLDLELRAEDEPKSWKAKLRPAGAEKRRGDGRRGQGAPGRVRRGSGGRRLVGHERRAVQLTLE